ncbi:DUF302 domain-containing protein [Phenylobacterium sp.]|uniref:DUF302 domain-containing protein n=1 Tax=Phenylobacterium sp. TaxID=1871053 RepID=UPI0025DC30B7|nr:DUF302 domain-containing protein [Phenylobacterium sp.]
MTHFARQSLLALAAGLSLAFCAGAVSAVADPAMAAAQPIAQGVVRVASVYGFDDTVSRLRADMAGKGIRFFAEIDQQDLARGAKIDLRPSKLLLFGNPPLGAQFLTSNPYAGLDWPVRILVTQDAAGKVWVAYTDFDYMAARYAITDRADQVKMASDVAGSIAASVAGK